MHAHTIRRATSLLAAIAVAGLAAGCGSDDDSASSTSSAKAPNSGDTVTLVAFSVPREAHEAIIPEFQKTTDGEAVEFEQSYGSSGEQSRAVEGGLPADLVHLALEPDVTRLVDAGKVDADWNANEHKGMVSDSIVVFAVRPGNPKKIETWDDLLADDIEIVTPNPFTSGGARWNLMAAYGAWTRAGDTKAEALTKLGELLKNTPVQSKSAREALQVFAGGKGDVLLAYENEAIAAQQKGEEVEYIVPASTILIENPLAVLNDGASPKAAKAYADFLYTEEAQKTFGDKGFRPVDEAVLATFDYEVPKDLFTIEDLGGWPKVMETFFDRENGEVAKLEQELGVPTDG